MSIFKAMMSATKAPAKTTASDWGWDVEEGASLGKGAPKGAFVGFVMIEEEGKKASACSLGRDKEVAEAVRNAQRHVEKKLEAASAAFHATQAAHGLARTQAQEIGQARKGLEAGKAMALQFRSQVEKFESEMMAMAKSSHEDLKAIEELLSDW